MSSNCPFCQSTDYGLASVKGETVPPSYTLFKCNQCGRIWRQYPSGTIAEEFPKPTWRERWADWLDSEMGLAAFQLVAVIITAIVGISILNYVVSSTRTPTSQDYLSQRVSERPHVRIILKTGDPVEGTLSSVSAGYTCVTTEQNTEHCIAYEQIAGWVLPAPEGAQ